MCIYNIPGRTGKNIEPETIIRLAELANIAHGQGSHRLAWIRLRRSWPITDLTLLSGDDSLTLPLLSVGGGGDLRGGQHRSAGHDWPW